MNSHRAGNTYQEEGTQKQGAGQVATVNDVDLRLKTTYRGREGWTIADTCLLRVACEVKWLLMKCSETLADCSRI